MKDKSKIFVKIQEFEDIKDILDLMKEKTNEARNILERIKRIKSEEDSFIGKWEENIARTEGKINSIRESLNNS
jgi:hypothetical protein